MIFLCLAANSVQTSQQLQTLAHQKSLNQESLQQTFMMSQLNSSQSTTPLQHPSTGSNSLRMNPLIAVQKPYTQPGIDLNNILRQSGGNVIVFNPTNCIEFGSVD